MGDCGYFWFYLKIGGVCVRGEGNDRAWNH